MVYAVSITSGSAVTPSFLRARIAGTVMRLPGTGVGVARLVPLSMVKVDMRAVLAGAAQRSQLRAKARRAKCQMV